MEGCRPGRALQLAQGSRAGLHGMLVHLVLLRSCHSCPATDRLRIPMTDSSRPATLCALLPQVLAKKLADYYKKKGVVLRVIDKYVAEIEMSDSGDVLQVGGWVGGWVGTGGRGRGGALGV